MNWQKMGSLRPIREQTKETAVEPKQKEPQRQFT